MFVFVPTLIRDGIFVRYASSDGRPTPPSSGRAKGRFAPLRLAVAPIKPARSKRPLAA